MNLPSLGFFPILALLAFLAAALLVEGLFLIWNSYRGPEAKKIEQRLRALSDDIHGSERSAVLKNRKLSSAPAVERLLLRIPRVQRLDQFLLQSGLEWTTARFLFLSALCGAAALYALSYSGLMPAITAAVAVLAVFIPAGFVQWMRGRRLRRMEQQLPDTLDLIGRALRAGHAFPSGLQMVGHEMSDPIATEFRVANDEINFGTSMQQALMNLSERVPVTDMRYFVVAVLVQREAGGNLTEVLDGLSLLIRNRLKFRGRVKVLTTEGRMSGWVLGLLPFGLAGVLNLVNPAFVSILWTDPAGIMITNILLVMMAVGCFWMYKLVKIRI
jgi:tight adherence protein B